MTATAHNLVAQLDADGKLSRRSLRRQARRSHPGKALLAMASQSPYLEHSGLPDIAQAGTASIETKTSLQLRILQNYRADYQTLKQIMAKADSRPIGSLRLQNAELDKKIARQRKINESTQAQIKRG